MVLGPTLLQMTIKHLNVVMIQVFIMETSTTGVKKSNDTNEEY